MLTIRQMQVDTFRTEEATKFFRRLALEFQQSEPSLRDVEIDHVIERLRQAQARALEYGIWEASDTTQFIEWVVHYGDGFGRDEATRWAAAPLNDKFLSGSEKVEALRALVAKGATR